MTKIKTVQEVKGKRSKIERLENVHFAYVFLQEPQHNKKSDKMEWVCSVITDEDTADEFSEKYPKASVNKVKTVDFEKRYKFAPPYPEEKNQWVIKMSVKPEYKDQKTGEMEKTPYHFDTRPKIYEVVDGKAVDITMDKKVASGSFGHIQYAASQTRYGMHPYMRALLITDLIEYQSSGGGSYNPFSDLVDEVVGAEVPVEQSKPEPVKQQQSIVKEPDFTEDEFDDMVPF